MGIKFEIYQFGVFGSNSTSDPENYKFNIGYLEDQPEELVASFCLEHTHIIWDFRVTCFSLIPERAVSFSRTQFFEKMG